MPLQDVRTTAYVKFETYTKLKCMQNLSRSKRKYVWVMLFVWKFKYTLRKRRNDVSFLATTALFSSIHFVRLMTERSIAFLLVHLASQNLGNDFLNLSLYPVRVRQDSRSKLNVSTALPHTSTSCFSRDAHIYLSPLWNLFFHEGIQWPIRRQGNTAFAPKQSSFSKKALERSTYQ